MSFVIRSVVEYTTLQRDANYPEKVVVQSKKKYIKNKLHMKDTEL